MRGGVRAWRPGRSSAGRLSSPGRSPSPTGRCARSVSCRRGGASPRPSPRRGAPGRATRRARRGRGSSAAGCPTARRPCRPMAPGAARTPLGLVAGGMVDLDRVPALHAAARLAVRAEGPQPHLAGEARVALAVAERHDLVEEGRPPQMAVSGRGESHPPALAEPDVNVSAHPAPIAQPSGRTSFQWAKSWGSRLATLASQAFARRGCPCNRLYFLMAQRTRPSLRCRNTGCNQDL
jgi:hypothetical protein